MLIPFTEGIIVIRIKPEKQIKVSTVMTGVRKNEISIVTDRQGKIRIEKLNNLSDTAVGLEFRYGFISIVR